MGGITKGEQDQFRINKSAIQHSNKSFRPVYKIAITYPKTRGHVVTKIIADTTQTAQRFFGLPVSDLVGLWIDQDDVGQPDKSVLLFRVDPTYTKDTMMGEMGDAITDADLAFNRYLSGRYWLDIWVGYKDAFTGELEPQDFNRWQSQAHLFSGPIEAINRKISNVGDMLQIVALSSERVLQFATFRTTNRNEEPEETAEQGKSDRTGTNNTLIIDNLISETDDYILYTEALYRLFNSLMSESEWAKRRKEAIPPEFAFVIGNFYWSIIRKSIESIKDLLKNKKIDQARKGYLPVLDNWITSRLFDGSVKMKTGFAVSKKADFWSCIQSLIRPEYNENIGCGFQVLKVSNPLTESGGPFLKEGILASHEVGHKKFVNQKGGHGGVHFQFFVPIDVDEFLEYYSLQEKKKKKKIIHESQFQKIIVGQDIVELDAYIEYSTCYNAFRTILRSPIKAEELAPFWQDIEKTKIFPVDFVDNPSGNILADLKKDRKMRGSKVITFWEEVLRDIDMFGLKEFPIEKWFAVDESEITEWRNRLAVDESIREDLVSSIPMKALAGHEGATEVFKRMYYAGLEGNAMIVGNPLIRPGKYLQIRDIRDAYSRSGSFVPETTEKIKDFTRNVTRKLMGFAELGFEPDRVTTSFDNPIGKSYFVWKTRHYIGAKSGYMSKVYFMKQRSRAWRKSGDTVGEIIRSAMRESREIFGGG